MFCVPFAPTNVLAHDLVNIFCKAVEGLGLNVSTTPITAMGCWQCLPLSVVQLKGKHCRKLHCRNDGVVNTFQPRLSWLPELLDSGAPETFRPLRPSGPHRPSRPAKPHRLFKPHISSTAPGSSRLPWGFGPFWLFKPIRPFVCLFVCLFTLSRALFIRLVKDLSETVIV